MSFCSHLPSVTCDNCRNNRLIITGTGIQQGWQCPSCKAVMAPGMPSCFYCRPVEKPQATAGKECDGVTPETYCYEQWETGQCRHTKPEGQEKGQGEGA